MIPALGGSYKKLATSFFCDLLLWICYVFLVNGAINTTSISSVVTIIQFK